MRFAIQEYKDEKDKKIQKESYLDKVGITKKYTKEELKDALKSKDPDGSCKIIYEGEVRDGVILSLSSNGSMTIGIV